MSNTLTAVLVTLLGKGLATLRRRVLLPSMVSRDNEPIVAMSKGKTVQVPIYERGTTTAVSASNTLLSPTASSPTYATVTLDNWYQSNFFLTDQELTQVADPEYIPNKLVGAFDALAAKINESLFGLYKDVGNYVGTAGTTPFASSQALMNNATAYLNKNDAPLSPRYGVLNYDAGANAKNISAIADVDTTGKDDIKIEGRLGRRYGVDWYEEGQVPTHTAGSLATATVATASVGATSVTVKDASTTTASSLLVGDILTFAGDTQTYTVTATASISTSSSASVSIFPALKVAQTGSSAVTLAASHVSNLVFHPGAFAFASRPESEALNLARQMGVAIEMMNDPLTGISYTLEVQRQHKQFVWILSCLWGYAKVRPELACRIAG